MADAAGTAETTGTARTAGTVEAAHPRKLRFGVELQQPFPDMTWADTFRRVEDLGYATAFFPDHFDEGVGPVAAMAAAVAVTTTLTVGTLVLACDFRHPAALGRELATIDALSDGRLEVGVGAGYKRVDYEQSGIELAPPKVRVDRLIEYVEVLQGSFGTDPFSFDGEHFQIRDLTPTPPPARPGGVPLLIGGGGPRMLRFAGRTAQIVGIVPSIHSGVIDAAAAQDGAPDLIDAKVDWVREGAGDRFDALELNAWIAIAEITDDATTRAEALAPVYETDADSVLASPVTLIGTEGEVADRLLERRERWGFSYHVIPGAAALAFAPTVAALTGT
ncbi:MAG TPA: TIGR03621 family F420-dependent LLM class oxidoreductase [Iamia sp.]|nr:TIGR03621 family F420-dependent LLM class oxidoreductase [Iamia sp.]